MGKLLTLVLLLALSACQSESGRLPYPKTIKLMTPSGDVIKTTLAITPAEQEQGLSGVKPGDFDEDEGMLFFYLQEDEKHFWMPDTYFELDIIYLNKDFGIVDIVRKLPFYHGRANPELIPRARAVWARHALEMKSSSSISQKLKVGDRLIWEGDLSPLELESKIRQLNLQ